MADTRQQLMIEMNRQLEELRLQQTKQAEEQSARNQELKEELKDLLREYFHAQGGGTPKQSPINPSSSSAQGTFNSSTHVQPIRTEPPDLTGGQLSNLRQQSARNQELKEKLKCDELIHRDEEPSQILAQNEPNSAKESSVLVAHQVLDEMPESQNCIKHNLCVDSLKDNDEGLCEVVNRIERDEERPTNSDEKDKTTRAHSITNGDEGLIEDVLKIDVALEQDLAAHHVLEGMTRIIDESVVLDLEFESAPVSSVGELDDSRTFKVSDLKDATSLLLFKNKFTDLLSLLNEMPAQEEIRMNYREVLCFDPGGRDLLVTDSLKFELPLQEKCGLWCIDELLNSDIAKDSNLSSAEELTVMTNALVGLASKEIFLSAYGLLFENVVCLDAFCFDPGGGIYVTDAYTVITLDHAHLSVDTNKESLMIDEIKIQPASIMESISVDGVFSELRKSYFAVGQDTQISYDAAPDDLKVFREGLTMIYMGLMCFDPGGLLAINAFSCLIANDKSHFGHPVGTLMLFPGSYVAEVLVFLQAFDYEMSAYLGWSAKRKSCLLDVLKENSNMLSCSLGNIKPDEEHKNLKAFEVNDLKYVTPLLLVINEFSDFIKFSSELPAQNVRMVNYIGVLCFDLGGGSLLLVDNSITIKLAEMTNVFGISLFSIVANEPDPFAIEFDHDKGDTRLLNLVLGIDLFGSVACRKVFCFDPGGEEMLSAFDDFDQSCTGIKLSNGAAELLAYDYDSVRVEVIGLNYKMSFDLTHLILGKKLIASSGHEIDVTSCIIEQMLSVGGATAVVYGHQEGRILIFIFDPGGTIKLNTQSGWRLSPTEFFMALLLRFLYAYIVQFMILGDKDRLKEGVL